MSKPSADRPVERTPAKRVTRLDIDALPHGTTHRLLLDLMDDALGLPIQLPMLVARGRRDGPVFGMTAALHGNELNGIPVIHDVFRHLDLDQLRGTVVAVVVLNVPGFRLHQRELDEGTDLNKIFPGRAKGNVAQVYAHRAVQKVVRRFDRLVDLHTASFGRINSLYARADMEHEVAAHMARLMRPQIILHNRPSDRTLRGTMMALGIPSVTIEIGDPQRFQPQFIKSTRRGIRRILADMKMLPKRKLNLGPPPVICDKSRWLYTDRGGLLEVYPELTDLVRKGDMLARLTDVFGEVVREYRVPEDAVVIGKSVNPAGATGARIAHLGRVAEPGRFRAQST
ncbi:MAG TPA: succinylglutamate desuccinylase/aspartoacylase family protein [Polyangiaceae bacterium LLY-WYZ-15_(1-7)]|nr:peptidase M14 [Myxococcales bacterium]MAT27430.1 peptidase M14 [Sandaracinus sp.]HJK90523.1 succinylglutamate desuccinylase/aspartoacylase family protein [Polyangiaceae bacterium LLY-WYZ-15_(1-7)]MBJ74558.1 peptidase M14 [Sandaracinus sp.]HJL05583.1 succinylglutamate desuccinylase/aspartoacylase family protein [Polyangiaceae bacterium LLY-WYZ-15_(1-7)]